MQATMNEASSQHCCEEMARHLGDREVAITYNPRLREYGIRLLGSDHVLQIILFCPWCGSRLPDSLREAWFRRLRDLGLEPGDTQIPAELRTDEWWRTRAAR